jgi:hypothetical protein
MVIKIMRIRWARHVAHMGKPEIRTECLKKLKIRDYFRDEIEMGE